MLESPELLAGVIACLVHCHRRALGWMVVHSSSRGAGCEMGEMGRHRRSIGGRKCSRGARSGAGDGPMHHGDGHPRRGASSRRRNEVDDPMKRALVEVAVAVVEDPMDRTLVELAVAVVEHPTKRTLGVVAVAVVGGLMKVASGVCEFVVVDLR